MNVTRLVSRTPSVDTVTRLRVRYIQLVSVIAVAVSLIGVFPLVISTARTGHVDALIRGLVTQSIVAAAGLVVLFLVRRGQRETATFILVLVLTFAAILTSDSQSFLLLAVLTLISAAALGRQFVYIAANVVVLGGTAWNIIQHQLARPTPFVLEPEYTQRVIVLVSLVIVSGVTRFFVRAIETANAEARRARDLLEAAAEIGHAISKLLNMDDLLNRAVELIRDRFAFYHVQVFLVDEARDYAVLVASTGEVGQQLLTRQHKLAVGSQSVIGRVTQRGEPLLAGDTATDSIYSYNELLPNTRSELALPVLDGDEIIGALDVQSTRRDAFNATDIQALQVMANQLATAIRNARLFAAQETSLQENKRLFLDSEANLRENQRLNRQLTKTAWAAYFKEKQTTRGITLLDKDLTPDADWTENMIQAGQRRRSITQKIGDTPVIAVPIVLRGEVLGAIEIEPQAGAREQETVEMIQAVAQRLAISLDRARLFEEAQEATAQQQRINEIVTQYQALPTVDDLLRVTLTELCDSLGAQHGSIRLGATPHNGHTHGEASS